MSYKPNFLPDSIARLTGGIIQMWDDIIQKEKRMKIVKTGATAIGLGIGCAVLQLFFPSEAGDNAVRMAFLKLGITFVIYGFSLLTVFAFRPLFLPTFYAITTYFLIPIPVIVFVKDIIDVLYK